jgi:DNA-binding winged helix-turn-helix (wHTH) protein/Tol biopolymer transport system component
VCRFGPFEVDFSNSKLLKSGIPIRVQDQPLLILEVLLEKPGEIVTREQLRERLWASETFVDFERSLNAAVAKLRQVLSDSAERPLYIETVARKGYRFIAPVKRDATESVAEQIALPERRSLLWPLVLVGAVVLAGAAILLLRSAHRPGAGDELGSIHFQVVLPEGSRMAEPSFAPQMAISPDGRKIALVTLGSGSGTSLWWRPLASETLVPVAGTEGAMLPFWSPDADEIGFFADGKLKIVKLPSGPVRLICEAPAFFGGTWNTKDVLLFSNGRTLLRVGASGGAPTQVTKLDGALKEVHHTWPQFLPDQVHFLYFEENAESDKSGVFLASLDGSQPKMVLANKTRGVIGKPNQLLFVRDGTLFAQTLGRGYARPQGRPIALANHVNSIYSYGQAAFSVSANGVVIYRSTEAETTQLVLYSRDGKRVKSFGPAGPYTQLTMSPDEKVAALNVKPPSDRIEAARIWLLRLDGEVISRLDFGGIANTDPVWSPDSRQIAFASFQTQDGQTQISQWAMGDPSPTLMLEDGNSNKPDEWSPGGFLLCRRNDRVAFSLPVQAGGRPHDLGDKPFLKDQLHLSPDGKMIAYNTWAAYYYIDKSSHPDVFVATFPGFGETTQVSMDGGVQPIWGRGGRELYYLALDGSVMGVEMASKGTVETGTPRLLFRSSMHAGQWRTEYSASADGQRFYLLEPVTPQRDILHVITRWGGGEGK